MASSEPWYTQAVRYSRLIRPFPVKKLADALYHVEADAASISDTLQALYRDPPLTADDWVATLDRLDMLLRSLQARCGDAIPVLGDLVDRAEGDHERGVRALAAILKNMPREEPAAAA